MIQHNYGKIIIKLDQVVTEKGLSKGKLAQYAEMERTQLNRYFKNDVTRLDTAVLARLCTALDCKIEDILEFIPADYKTVDFKQDDRDR